MRALGKVQRGTEEEGDPQPFQFARKRQDRGPVLGSQRSCGARVGCPLQKGSGGGDRGSAVAGGTRT